MEKKHWFLFFRKKSLSVIYNSVGAIGIQIFKTWRYPENQTVYFECTIIDITPGIKELVISIRKKYIIKLPDAIILATSIWLNMPLITADHDFTKIDIADLIYFQR
jgi:predicted nucleic acid-binding protein